MNDNKPDISNIKDILLRSKKELHKETKLYLARELKHMVNFEGDYKEFKSITTPLMQEIWFMIICYLEEDV